MAAYHENGYVVPDFRLTSDELTEIRSAHDRLLAKHREFRDHCPNLLAFDPSFLTLARHSAILELVCQVIGLDFALWNSSFLPSHLRMGSERLGTRVASIGLFGH